MHHPKIWLLAGTLAVTLLGSGCATITRGSSEQLVIKTIPSGASVRLSNGFTGVTPAIFTVPRKGAIIVALTKDGYESQEVTLDTGVAGKGAAGFAGNVLIGGIIGGGIDLATGATLSHKPNPLEVTLKPKPSPPAAPPQPAAVTSQPMTQAALSPETKVSQLQKIENE